MIIELRLAHWHCMHLLWHTRHCTRKSMTQCAQIQRTSTKMTCTVKDIRWWVTPTVRPGIWKTHVQLKGPSVGTIEVYSSLIKKVNLSGTHYWLWQGARGGYLSKSPNKLIFEINDTASHQIGPDLASHWSWLYKLPEHVLRFNHAALRKKWQDYMHTTCTCSHSWVLCMGNGALICISRQPLDGFAPVLLQ